MLIEFEVLEPKSCDGCGLCCEGNGSPVLLYASRPDDPSPHPFRPLGLPAELIREIDGQFDGLARGQEPQDRCLWFDADTRRCKHYAWRPQACHDYELGGGACLAARRTNMAAGAELSQGFETRKDWRPPNMRTL